MGLKKVPVREDLLNFVSEFRELWDNYQEAFEGSLYISIDDDNEYGDKFHLTVGREIYEEINDWRQTEMEVWAEDEIDVQKEIENCESAIKYYQERLEELMKVNTLETSS